MRPPCEQSLRYLIPQLRAHLAHHLKISGWSQNKIADELGITQAAVSGYLKQYEKHTSFTTPLFHETIKKIHRRLLEGTNTADTVVADICSLCLSQRVEGPLCRQHRIDVPALNQCGCTVCYNFPSGKVQHMIKNRTAVITTLVSALRLLQAHKLSATLLPEVRSNIVYSIPNAKVVEDIAGFPGRLTKIHERIVAAAHPEFGASTHTARLLLAAHEIYPGIRAAFCICSKPSFIKSINAASIPFITIKPRKDGLGPDQLTLSLKKKSANFFSNIFVVHSTGRKGVESILYLFADTPVKLVETAIKLLGPNIN
ncbi:MAG: thiamine-phosphate synthase family protein [Candidatus Ranarchaeia archaeon]